MSLLPEEVRGEGRPMFTSGTSRLKPSILVTGFSIVEGTGIFSRLFRASKALFDISLVGEVNFSVIPFQIRLW